MVRTLLSCFILIALAGAIFSCSASKSVTVDTPAIQQEVALPSVEKVTSDNNPGSCQSWGGWSGNRREIANAGPSSALPINVAISQDRIPFQSFGNPVMGDQGSIYVKGVDNYLYKFINNGAGIIQYLWVNTPFPSGNPAVNATWQKLTSPAILGGGDICYAADSRFIVVEDLGVSGVEVASIPYNGYSNFSSPTIYSMGGGISYIYFTAHDLVTLSSTFYCLSYDDATKNLALVWQTPFVEIALGAPMVPGPQIPALNPIVWIEVSDAFNNAIVYGYDALTGTLVYFTNPLGPAPTSGSVTYSNGMLVTATSNAVVCLPWPLALPLMPPQLLVPINLIASAGTISAPLCANGNNRVYGMETLGVNVVMEAFNTFTFGIDWMTAPINGAPMWAPLSDSLGDVFITTDTDFTIVEPLLGAITYTQGPGFLCGPPMLGQDNRIYHTWYNQVSNTTTLNAFSN